MTKKNGLANPIRLKSRQNPPALLEAEFVLVAVVFVQIAPIASQMSLQKREQ